jgi:subtilisin
LNGYAAVIPAGRLAALSRDPDVAFINRDEVMYADAVSTGGAWGVDRIDAEPNDATANDGTGARVAVIDTGIDLDHPDLAPNVVNGKNTISTTGTIYSDCALGRGNTGPTSADDDNGHGTHVAGTIGAKNDGAGVVGVAPGAMLYAVKVLNAQGSGYVSDIICGINWVTSTRTDADPNNNIDVANMSLGGTGSDDGKSCAQTTNAYKKAICNSVGKEVNYVVSAGNDGSDLANKRPASFRDRDDTTGTSKPLVLTVTAITDYNGKPGGGAAATCRSGTDDTPASFSNYATNANNQAHTIAAPGVCIKSTWKAGAYNTISGTSMAAPHVAGTAAMCRARSQCTSKPADILTKLRGDAQSQPAHPTYGWNGAPGTEDYYGYMAYAGGYRSSGGTTVDLAAASDTGASNTDNVTNDNTPTFTGTAKANSTVKIYAGSTLVCETTTVDASGNYSCTLSSALANGTHSITATATDAAGTTSPASAALNVTIDTAAPTVPDGSLSPANGATGVALDASVSATFSEAMDPATLNTNTFTLVPQGSTATVGTSVTYDAATKKATLNHPNLTSSTTYNATVKSGTGGAKDVAGNALATDKGWSFTTGAAPADTTPPSVSLTAPADGAKVSGTVTLSANASDNTGVKEVRFYVNGVLVGTDTTSPYSVSWDSTSVPEGDNYTIQAEAYDAAGNKGTSASRTVKVAN